MVIFSLIMINLHVAIINVNGLRRSFSFHEKIRFSQNSNGRTNLSRLNSAHL